MNPTEAACPGKCSSPRSHHESTGNSGSLRWPYPARPHCRGSGWSPPSGALCCEAPLDTLWYYIHKYSCQCFQLGPTGRRFYRKHQHVCATVFNPQYPSKDPFAAFESLTSGKVWVESRTWVCNNLRFQIYSREQTRIVGGTGTAACRIDGAVWALSVLQTFACCDRWDAFHSDEVVLCQTWSKWFREN